MFACINHKITGHFYQNVILFTNAVLYKCTTSVWSWSNDYNKHLIDSVESDGLIKAQKNIRSYGAEYALMHFQMFIG